MAVRPLPHIDGGLPSAGALAGVSDERLRMFVDFQLPHRTLTVAISRADERRLVRNIETFNLDVPDDPLNPNHDDDLAVALMGCALRGLDVDDDDAGVWSDLDGTPHALPRPNRAPLWMRLRFARRAALLTWRAS
jgi:hypothetical protein